MRKPRLQYCSAALLPHCLYKGRICCRCCALFGAAALLVQGTAPALCMGRRGCRCRTVTWCCCRELKQQLAEHPELYKQLQQELAAEQD
jgi:hypothetical protein